MLNRLSVFAGGWTLDATEAVCPGEGIERHDVLVCISVKTNTRFESAELTLGIHRL